MIELVHVFKSDKPKVIPEEFAEVALCEQLGCLYTDLMAQPQWWIDRRIVWMKARIAAQGLRTAKIELNEKHTKEDSGKKS